MAVDFEEATAALFARIAHVTGVVYSTRVLESWDDTPPVKMPALMLTSRPIEPIVQKDPMLPPMWKLMVGVILYVKSPDPRTAPSTLLNPLIAAVCNALLLQPGEISVPAAGAQFVVRPPGQVSTTLGGLCQYARVSATIDRFEGLIGHTAAASIPIEMVLTS